MCLCCRRLYDGTIINCWEQCFSRTPQPLSEVSPTLKTGDCLLFRCSPGYRWAGQYMLAASPWDHVGIIWVHEGKHSGHTSTDKGLIQPYVIDTAPFRYWDFCFRPLDFGEVPSEEWQKGGGPQMCLLKDFIKAQESRGPVDYKGDHHADRGPWHWERVAVRRLQNPLTEAEVEKLREFVLEIRDHPWETSEHETMFAAIDLPACCEPLSRCLAGTDFRSRQGNISSLFCSETVAACYLHLGLLPPDPPSNEYVPADFSPDHGSNWAGLSCCCFLSWWLARSKCTADLRNHKHGGPLFQTETEIRIPIPPRGWYSKKVVPEPPVMATENNQLSKVTRAGSGSKKS